MRRGQAAAGASLIVPEPPDGRPTEPTPAVRHGRLLVTFAVIAVAVWALDQVTKALAVAHLTQGRPVRVLGPILDLRLIRNSGAAFSTATGMTWVLTVIAVVVVVLVIRFARRLGSRGWAVALGLLLGGALGNLTDRLTREPAFGRGHVVDFLEFPHWPIFNLADTAVVTSGALILLLSLRGIRIEGHPHA